MTRAINQIHDVGKLIREAVSEGWSYAAGSRGMGFTRGDRIVQAAVIVRDWETLREHRRALGLDNRKTSEAAP